MIKVVTPDRCCGCGNCINKCPRKAISFVKDKYGFIFSQVDNEKCVNCALCEKVCPIINHQNQQELNHRAFIAYSKNDRVRFNGSSGGIFGSIALDFFQQNNTNRVVYGASFNESLKLELAPATNVELLTPLYKSKYLQSDLGERFFEIKEKLDVGESVLFTATPCQVSALKLFLGKEYDNLITVDFVCHGVPSQDFFDKCKEYVEKRDKIKIVNYQFRAKKKNGSTPHYYKITYLKNNRTYSKLNLYTKSPFYLGFQKYITLRDSCYNCQFAYSNRCSDITIGDFHEVDEYVSDINRFDGVSLFVINSKKGELVWQRIKDGLIFHELDIQAMIQTKKIFAGGTQEPLRRKQFLYDLETKAFDCVVKKHLNSKKEWKKDIYYSLPTFLRNKLKKMMGM